jgi:hypothetical protein
MINKTWCTKWLPTVVWLSLLYDLPLLAHTAVSQGKCIKEKFVPFTSSFNSLLTSHISFNKPKSFVSFSFITFYLLAFHCCSSSTWKIFYLRSRLVVVNCKDILCPFYLLSSRFPSLYYPDFITFLP